MIIAHHGLNNRQFQDYLGCLRNLKVGDIVSYYKVKYSNYNLYCAVSSADDPNVLNDNAPVIFITNTPSTYDIFPALPSIVIGSTLDPLYSGLQDPQAVRDVYRIPLPPFEKIKSARVLDSLIMVAGITKAR